jgi:hypothetical protein
MIMNAKQIDQDTAGSEDFMPQLELLLIYEDIPTALRAKRAVDHVMGGQKAPADCQIHAWKIDLLHDPDCSEQAMQDALAADILVLSTHGNNNLSSKAASHLKQWVGLKRGTPCALVVSLDSEAKLFTDVNPELTELCFAATRNGMTVILHAGDPLVSADNDTHTEILHGALETSRFAAAAAPVASMTPHRWGINE